MARELVVQKMKPAAVDLFRLGRGMRGAARLGGVVRGVCHTNWTIHLEGGMHRERCLELCDCLGRAVALNQKEDARQSKAPLGSRDEEDRAPKRAADGSVGGHGGGRRAGSRYWDFSSSGSHEEGAR